MSITLRINGDAVEHHTITSVIAHLNNVLSGYSTEELLANPPTIEFISVGDAIVDDREQPDEED